MSFRQRIKKLVTYLTISTMLVGTIPFQPIGINKVYNTKAYAEETEEKTEFKLMDIQKEMENIEKGKGHYYLYMWAYYDIWTDEWKGYDDKRSLNATWEEVVRNKRGNVKIGGKTNYYVPISLDILYPDGFRPESVESVIPLTTKYVPETFIKKVLSYPNTKNTKTFDLTFRKYMKHWELYTFDEINMDLDGVKKTEYGWEIPIRPVIKSTHNPYNTEKPYGFDTKVFVDNTLRKEIQKWKNDPVKKAEFMQSNHGNMTYKDYVIQEFEKEYRKWAVMPHYSYERLWDNVLLPENVMGTRYYAPILVKFKEGKDLAVKPEGDLYIAHITGEKPKTAVRVDFRMKSEFKEVLRNEDVKLTLMQDGKKIGVYNVTIPNILESKEYSQYAVYTKVDGVLRGEITARIDVNPNKNPEEENYENNYAIARMTPKDFDIMVSNIEINPSYAKEGGEVEIRVTYRAIGEQKGNLLYKNYEVGLSHKGRTYKGEVNFRGKETVTKTFKVNCPKPKKMETIEIATWINNPDITGIEKDKDKPLTQRNNYETSSYIAGENPIMKGVCSAKGKIETEVNIPYTLRYDRVLGHTRCCRSHRRCHTDSEGHRHCHTVCDAYSCSTYISPVDKEYTYKAKNKIEVKNIWAGISAPFIADLGGKTVRSGYWHMPFYIVDMETEVYNNKDDLTYYAKAEEMLKEYIRKNPMKVTPSYKNTQKYLGIEASPKNEVLELVKKIDLEKWSARMDKGTSYVRVKTSKGMASRAVPSASKYHDWREEDIEYYGRCGDGCEYRNKVYNQYYKDNNPKVIDFLRGGKSLGKDTTNIYYTKTRTLYVFAPKVSKYKYYNTDATHTTGSPLHMQFYEIKSSPFGLKFKRESKSYVGEGDINKVLRALYDGIHSQNRLLTINFGEDDGWRKYIFPNVFCGKSASVSIEIEGSVYDDINTTGTQYYEDEN